MMAMMAMIHMIRPDHPQSYLCKFCDGNLRTVSSIATRIKGMSKEEKEEFICLMNDDEQDFAKA